MRYDARESTPQVEMAVWQPDDRVTLIRFLRDYLRALVVIGLIAGATYGVTLWLIAPDVLR